MLNFILFQSGECALEISSMRTYQILDVAEVLVSGKVRVNTRADVRIKDPISASVLIHRESASLQLDTHEVPVTVAGVGNHLIVLGACVRSRSCCR